MVTLELRCFPLAILTAALLASNAAASDVEPPEGYMALFDGESMDGWFFRPSEPQLPWQVDEEEGTLGRVIHGGYIWTDDAYDDFEIVFEYKLSWNCNSGVFIRSNPQSPVQEGLEIQLLDTRGELNKNTHGSLYNAKEASSLQGVKPNEWHAMRIRAKGDLIQVWINGVHVLDADLSKWTEAEKNPDGTKNKFERPLSKFAKSGHIGFQDHGHNVWFRNIFLKTL